MKRYALVSIRNTTSETIARYLPANYETVGDVLVHENPVDDSDYEGCFGPCVLIAGEDNAGWTMEDYVLPRLASGLHVGREVPADHPAVVAIFELRS